MELDWTIESFDVIGTVGLLVSLEESRVDLKKLKILEGRQYGRGKTGGQVRDEYRTDYDPGRGGYGKRNEDHPRKR